MYVSYQLARLPPPAAWGYGTLHLSAPMPLPPSLVTLFPLPLPLPLPQGVGWGGEGWGGVGWSGKGGRQPRHNNKKDKGQR